jgi:ribosomal protein S18 acetylase RimI-like enzyme
MESTEPRGPGTFRCARKQSEGSIVDDIRPYADTDEQAVIDLWRSIFAYSTPHNDPATAIRNKLAVQRELFFVAATEEQVIGTVMGGYDGHRGWIYSLAVNPQQRRQGIGAALVRRVEKALLDRGCLKINLQVLPANADVVAFYQKLGYKVEERISMGKILPPA